VDNFLVYWRFI